MSKEHDDKELDDYEMNRDESNFDDVERNIRQDNENDLRSDDRQEELLTHLEQEREQAEKNSRDNDFPTENMDEEDTPFGTGD
jgi:hypothetical protein